MRIWEAVLVFKSLRPQKSPPPGRLFYQKNSIWCWRFQPPVSHQLHSRRKAHTVPAPTSTRITTTAIIVILPELSSGTGVGVGVTVGAGG